ncbi:MAG: diacylglycerol kinase family lipid kinase [Vicingaceae bacterium]|nr:diacylglycerol kinase family lipid kinase [Vicingaceae bacterium]
MINKSNILFIINPISGTGKQKIVEKLIEQHLNKEIFDYTIIYTRKAKHAIEISKNEVQNFDVIVAVGGDGTVNETATAIIGTEKILAIIPTGSGNGLARHLKISTNIKNAIEIINNKKIKRIDTATVNDIHFLGTAGTGFDAHIGWKFATAEKRGFWSYVKITIKEYFNYDEANYTLIVDGAKSQQKSLLITFANSNQYGNNACVSPNSVIDDGFLRIIILKKFPLTYSFAFAYKMFTKKFNTFKYVTEMKGKNITIHSPKKELHIDGEPYLLDTNLTLKINPKSLNIFVP